MKPTNPLQKLLSSSRAPPLVLARNPLCMQLRSLLQITEKHVADIVEIYVDGVRDSLWMFRDFIPGTLLPECQLLAFQGAVADTPGNHYEQPPESRSVVKMVLGWIS